MNIHERNLKVKEKTERKDKAANTFFSLFVSAAQIKRKVFYLKLGKNYAR